MGAHNILCFYRQNPQYSNCCPEDEPHYPHPEYTQNRLSEQFTATWGAGARFQSNFNLSPSTACLFGSTVAPSIDLPPSPPPAHTHLMGRPRTSGEAMNCRFLPPPNPPLISHATCPLCDQCPTDTPSSHLGLWTHLGKQCKPSIAKEEGCHLPALRPHNSW